MRWLAGIVAMLAFAPAAYGQGATVQALDDTSTWSPSSVDVRVGETVTWTWDGDPPHNVKSTTPNWDVDYHSPVAHKFEAIGTYDYVCEFHPGMNGRVVVTDASGTPPPPPPPPPPSEQHWANDQAPPTVFELVDEVRPRLSRVRIDAVRNGARVRFRLSERAQVTVRLRLGVVVVKSARKTFGAGPGRLAVRNRRLDGRYRGEVFARDLSGNRSRVERDRVTVR